MRGRAAAFALAALAAAPALAQPPRIPLGLHYAVAAPRGAAYALHCKFRAVRIRGHYDMDRGLVNHIDLSGKGPQRGRLPADNARCTLKQTGDRGPIALAVVKERPYTARVAANGAEAKIYVP